MRAHRTAQLEERLRAGSEWQDNGLVFTQPNGKPVDPRADNRAWKALLRDAGVRDARLHDARTRLRRCCFSKASTTGS